jgi:tryptophan synthase alpha chain
MNRIEKKFREIKRSRKKAFVAFITAGYPNLSITEKLVLEFARRGVDIVELGVPFSDPLADGQVIQESSAYALKKGVHLKDIMGLVKRLRLKTEIPICLMTYYNPVFAFGENKFCRQARLSGVDGMIIPDLPPEEGKLLLKSARKEGLDVISFIAPTTEVKRIKYISRITTGFIYYVSLTGVTGARSRLPKDLLKNIRMVKMHTHKPVCVGFGVSNRSQARQILNVADGVIVGSAIVRKIKENIGQADLVRKVSNFVSSLRG